MGLLDRFRRGGQTPRTPTGPPADAEVVADLTTWIREVAGDYDRLTAAFDELADAGVLARMDFTCCQTCGHAEIGDERADDSPWGYTFFHQQDTERLGPEGSDLYLAFGTFETGAGELGDVRAASAVAEVLRRHGLDVAWDGTAGQRIRVTGLDWRKRLPV